MRRILVVAFLTFLSANVAGARTWNIRPDGSGDAPTIQAGIDSAAAGDQVVLAPGTYTWTSQAATGPSMIRMKRDVAVLGEAGAAHTVVDAERRGRVVECTDVGDARLEGLTITHGYVNAFDALGGGVLSIGDSRLAVADCTIRGNDIGGMHAAGGGFHGSGGSIVRCEFEENQVGAGQSCFGGGIDCTGTSIRACTIRANRAYAGEGGGRGAGISATGSRIEDCRIEANLNFGGYFGGEGGGAALVDCNMLRCIVAGNRLTAEAGFTYGGGLSCSSSIIGDCLFISNYVRGNGIAGVEIWGGAGVASPYTYVPTNPSTITNCTLIANIAEQVGSTGISPVGGILLQWNGEVRNCIFADNTGAACYGPTAVFACNDLFHNSGGDAVCGTDGGGNFSADPQFCAADPASSLNVTLQSDSPCAPGNHLGGVPCGLVGAGPVACGSVSVQSRTWSQIKNSYR